MIKITQADVVLDQTEAADDSPPSVSQVARYLAAATP